MSSLGSKTAGVRRGASATTVVVASWLAAFGCTSLLGIDGNYVESIGGTGGASDVGAGGQPGGGGAPGANGGAPGGSGSDESGGSAGDANNGGSPMNAGGADAGRPDAGSGGAPGSGGASGAGGETDGGDSPLCRPGTYVGTYVGTHAPSISVAVTVPIQGAARLVVSPASSGTASATLSLTHVVGESGLDATALVTIDCSTGKGKGDFDMKSTVDDARPAAHQGPHLGRHHEPRRVHDDRGGEGLRHLGREGDGAPFRQGERRLQRDLPAVVVIAARGVAAIARPPRLRAPPGASRADCARGRLPGRAVSRSAARAAVEQGERLALEVIWTARVAVPLGSIPAGGEMRARFGVFLRYRDGLIVEQHNYDCFDPF